MAYRLTKYETETTIIYNDADETAILYTCNKALQRKMARLKAKVTEQDAYSVTYEIPKKWVKVSPPRKVSEETAKAAGERLRKMHKSKVGATVISASEDRRSEHQTVRGG